MRLSNVQNPLCPIGFHKILRYCLQSVRPSLNQLCSALEVKLWLWNFQQKIILLHWKIYDLRILSFNGDSKSLSPLRAAECFRPSQMFMGVDSVRKHETGLECDQRLSRKMRIKVAAHGRGKELAIQNRRLRCARRNVFGLCRWLKMLNRSENTKQGSKGVSGCWENRDLLCSCTGEERRDPTENAKCNSRGGVFSAFVGVDACRIGPETRNGAQKGSVVAEKIENYCDRY